MLINISGCPNQQQFWQPFKPVKQGTSVLSVLITGMCTSGNSLVVYQLTRYKPPVNILYVCVYIYIYIHIYMYIECIKEPNNIFYPKPKKKKKKKKKKNRACQPTIYICSQCYKGNVIGIVIWPHTLPYYIKLIVLLFPDNIM